MFHATRQQFAFRLSRLLGRVVLLEGRLAGSFLRTTQACVCSGPVASETGRSLLLPRSGMHPLCLRERCQRAPSGLLFRPAVAGAWASFNSEFSALVKGFSATQQSSLIQWSERIVARMTSELVRNCSSTDLKAKTTRFTFTPVRALHVLDDAGADIRFARNEPPTQEDLAPPGEKWRLHRDATLAERGASFAGTIVRDDGGDVSNAFVTLWLVDENGLRNSAGAVAAVQKVNVDGSFDIRFLAPGRIST